MLCHDKAVNKLGVFLAVRYNSLPGGMFALDIFRSVLILQGIRLSRLVNLSYRKWMCCQVSV